MGLTKGNLSRQITVGGFTFDWDPINNANDIELVGFCSGTASTNCTLRNKSATAGYQVPVGKTLNIIAVKLVNPVAVLSSGSLVGADNDMGYGTVTAPTNPTYHGGTANVPYVATPATAGSTAEVGGLLFQVAATKYPGIIAASLTASQGSYFVYGKLV